MEKVSDKLSVAELKALRKQGLSYSQIAKLIGFSSSAVGRYAKEVLPSELRQQSTLRRKIERLLDKGHEIEGIAELLHCKLAYVKEVRYRRQSRTEKARAKNQCPRCTLIAEPTNPLGPDGFCLWCRVEMSGQNVREWYENGAEPVD